MKKNEILKKPKKLVRVLHVAETMRGGLSTYLEEVIGHQVGDALYESVMLVAPASDILQSTAIPSRSFPFDRAGRDFGSFLRLSIAIYKAVLGFKPNIVHLHSSFAGLIGRIILSPYFLSGRVRVVYTAHGWSYLALPRSWQKWVGMRLERILALLSSAVVAVSTSEKSLAIDGGIEPEKIHVIYNPRTPLEDVHASNDLHVTNSAELNLLYVGRLDQAKGFDLLMEALTIVRRNDWTLDVVGEPIHDSMPVVPKKISSRVRLRGWLSGEELARAYRASDCVVIPSRWEAFGLVAIEAMQLQRAVYASRVGGLVEIIEDGRSGQLIEPTVHAWANAIDNIKISDLHAYGVEGRERAKRDFSANASNRKLDDLYKHLVRFEEK